MVRDNIINDNIKLETNWIKFGVSIANGKPRSEKYSKGTEEAEGKSQECLTPKNLSTDSIQEIQLNSICHIRRW